MSTLSRCEAAWLNPDNVRTCPPDTFVCPECGENRADISEMVHYCVMCSKKVCTVCAIETIEGDIVCSEQCHDAYKRIPVKEDVA